METKNVKFLSVCIPTYEMRGLGHIYLKESFDILCEQIFKNFEVIICDNSKDSKVKELCEEYSKKLDLYYFPHPQGTSISSNLNFVLKNKCCKGEFIKILAQDDFLYDNTSLEKIIENLDRNKDNWIATACIHTENRGRFFKTVYPKYNSSIHLGNNTIGGLSVITIKNDTNPLTFDENLLWLTDCEYYKRCYNRYGKPKIINEIATVVRLGDHNITNTEATLEIRTHDFNKVLDQYEHGFMYWYYKFIYFTKYPIRKLKLNLLKKYGK